LIEVVSDFALDVNRVMMTATIALPIGGIFELALKDVVAAFAVVAAYFVSHDSDEKDDKEKSHWLP
jgi:hypothetical protein